MTNSAPAGKVVDGNLVICKEPQVSCWDHGLLYGYGLFETMRVYGGRIFVLKAHLQRLLSSCDQLGIGTGLSLDDLVNLAGKYVAESEMSNVALRLTITRGDFHRGIPPGLFITSRQLTYLPGHYEQGFSAVTSPVRRNPTSPLVYHKTLNYMDSLLALEEARGAGAQEALFLNTNHRLAEGAISNLFFVRDGIIHTPAVTCGLLSGITRKTVIDLAAAMGYQAIEGEYAMKNLLAAEEAFLTNSLMEVMPLVKVDGIPINHGKPGRVTEDLLQGYRALTLKEEPLTI
ncbi:hypothetical protein SY88_09110 [Clostridiales bacterium PH28_bin88]|nr:hypothetical protein SY88_09110 [Clostridiales bacterium PH28_bin88]